MTNISIAVRAADMNTLPSFGSLGQTSGEMSQLPEIVSRTFPPAIAAGQAYYWSQAWQAGQQETLAALVAGQGFTFETAEDAIRWLLSEDHNQA